MKQAFSPLRQSILDIVERSVSPLSAHNIFEAIGGSTAFSTVYRALWYLEERGEIDGFPIECEPCGKDRFFVGTSLGHVHFFHCEKCHGFIPVSGCDLTASVEKKYGVKIRRHVLFFTGLCADCSSKGE